MNADYDVAVIGGGVIGVCSAYFLAQRGIRVVLIEKGDIASGCSYGNGGLIVPSDIIPLASPGALGNGLRWLRDPESPFYIKPRLDRDLISWLLRFVFASRPSRMHRAMPVLCDLLMNSATLYEELSHSAGFDFGYERKGTLWVCLSKSRWEREVQELDFLETFHIPAKAVDQNDVHDLEPALLPQVAGGIYYPKDGHIDPFRFVSGLAEKARQLDVRLLSKTEVMSFEISNKSITRIRTTRGDIRAREVVLAAGSWSPEIGRSLRLHIPIQPAKGYSVTLENPNPLPKLPLMLAEARVVVNPLGDALRLAGTLEMAGMDFSIDPRRLHAVHTKPRDYLPGLAEAKVIEIWRGLRPCTPDGLPIISRSKDVRNLIVAAGHAMLGMSLGPITGKLVAQLVCEQKPDMDIAPIRMDRFS